MASLDARLWAPLPLEQLQLRIARLQPWRRGAPGRFAVTYVSGAAPSRPIFPGGPTLNLDPGAFALVRTAPLVAAGVIALLLAVLALAHGLERRWNDEDALFALEQRAAAELHASRELLRRKSVARQLDTLDVQARGPEQVLTDLAWVGAHRRPSIPVLAFHWRAGIAAVEVASDTGPFDRPDRQVERAATPLRPGVWLFGVERAGRGR